MMSMNRDDQERWNITCKICKYMSRECAKNSPTVNSRHPMWDAICNREPMDQR